MNRRTTLGDDNDVIKVNSAVSTMTANGGKSGAVFKMSAGRRNSRSIYGSGRGSGQGNGNGSGGGTGIIRLNQTGYYSPITPKIISGGVINGKAKNLPIPPYPPAARAVRASGAVNMQVTIDESGNVISAKAVSGHPLLRAAAEQAARNAKFAPTMLSGQAVKTMGVIVYNFSAANNSAANVTASLGEMNVQSEETKEVSAVTPEMKRRQMLAEKLHVWLFALVERLQKGETAQTPSEAKFVKDGRAEVQIRFSDKTPAAVEKLKALGFEVLEERQNKIVGKIAIEKIAGLAEIIEVRYVLPQIK